MLDISNALLRASTALVAAPEAPALPSAPPRTLAPAIAVPPTPDILAADAPLAAGDTPR